eukprot:TRINITY_DN8049_c0_g4_i2.p1 TRINITY_DN8049_c0_g4~~TRINITY_DN8049_c0_g4_i2.p1  ORF type:complete len:353 (+),score=78.33 TRINITY_DN8049_c0_g4_i2:402-1460(+)
MFQSTTPNSPTLRPGADRTSVARHRSTLNERDVAQNPLALALSSFPNAGACSAFGMEVMRGLLRRHPRMALLIGNGPNIASGLMPSWQDLLTSAGSKRYLACTEGLSNTEVYDLVQLHASDTARLKAKVVDMLALKRRADLRVHRDLMEFARGAGVPVLTTNFDAAFETSIGAKKHILAQKERGFTHYYPWNTYYADEPLGSPLDGFGVWKIHGDVRYPHSIRLGLLDYMGSVERARRLLYYGDPKGAKRTSLWRGRLDEAGVTEWFGDTTWLHVWFHLPIVISGLRYGADEIFLRWLLIERKMWKDARKERMDVYYVSKGTPDPAVLNLMTNIGVDIIRIDCYSELYPPAA